MPQPEKGMRGKGRQPFSPPQHLVQEHGNRSEPPAMFVLPSPSVRSWGFLDAMLAFAIAVSLPTVGAATDRIISLRGAGPVRLGMTLSEACAYLESKAIPEHLGFMFAHCRVVRVDVSHEGIRTVSGAGVGDSQARNKQLYSAQITIEPHHYEPEKGHYLNYWSKSAKHEYGIVFETDG